MPPERHGCRRLHQSLKAIDDDLKGEQAEALEVVALETSDIVAKPLRRVAFPKGAIVAGIIRKDHIIIPTGESIIEPGDRIIIFAQRRAVEGIEKILAVKLEYF